MRFPTVPAMLAAAAMLVPTAAVAGEPGRGLSVVEHIFDMADRNGDGVLSRAEYDGAGLPAYGVSFDASDLDSNGETSKAEYIELYERLHPGAGEEEVGI